MDAERIAPLEGRTVDAVVELPGSKSITNRALLLAALAEGTSELRRVLHSEDTEVFMTALGRLGVPLRMQGDTVWVQGIGGGPRVDRAEIDVRLSGTSARFLCPFLALGTGHYRVDGTPRMRQRPMRELIDALRAFGVHVQGGPGLPLEIRGRGSLPGGAVRLTAAQSSQHLSGILMVAPYAEGEVTVELIGEVVSEPYVDMTVAMMRHFGAEVEAADGVLRVSAPRRYHGRVYEIEPDASAACYFWSLAALSGGRVRTPGLVPGRCLQGDVRFLEVLQAMGCTVRATEGGTVVEGPPGGRLRAVEVDMNAISDQVPTLAALALFADGPCTVHRVGHVRGKESDRLAAAAEEVRRLGGEVLERPDGLTVIPPERLPTEPVLVRTYGDHRMAMAFALVGLRRPGVSVAEPDCVAKTFPEYFAVLRSAVGGQAALHTIGGSGI